MQVTEQTIRDVVDQVLAQIAVPATPPVAASPSSKDCKCPGKAAQDCGCEDKKFEGQYTGRYGLFTNVDEAVAAATHAF